MSKRVTNFESHEFHNIWKELKNKINEIDASIITDELVLQELGRLRKVIEYIDKYIKIIDPDINSLGLTSNLTTCNSHITQATSRLNTFITTPNISYIDQANSMIDNCLKLLNEYNIMLPKVSGQSINAMLKKYNETLEEGLSQIQLPIIVTASKEIKALKEELLDGTDEEDSIEFKINTIYIDIEEKHKKLVEFYNNILNDVEFDDTIKEQVEKAKSFIEESLLKVKEDTLELSNKIDSFEKYHVNVFGELNDNGERVGGLKSELEKRIKILDDFEVEQQKVHEEKQVLHERTLNNKLAEIKKYEKEQQTHNKNLYQQIESYLPGATSAGLAKAYHDERKNFILPKRIWSAIFILSLILISYVSFQTLNDITGIEDFTKSILHTLPISGPLIWLAMYASNRRNENQKLEQEYAHKEALANSYSSYKQQIEDLKLEDQELLSKLLETAITTMSKNASEVLDKKHGDGTPVQEGIKIIIDEVKKLNKK